MRHTFMISLRNISIALNQDQSLKNKIKNVLRNIRFK